MQQHTVMCCVALGLLMLSNVNGAINQSPSKRIGKVKGFQAKEPKTSANRILETPAPRPMRGDLAVPEVVEASKVVEAMPTEDCSCPSPNSSDRPKDIIYVTSPSLEEKLQEQTTSLRMLERSDKQMERLNYLTEQAAVLKSEVESQEEMIIGAKEAHDYLGDRFRYMEKIVNKAIENESKMKKEISTLKEHTNTLWSDVNYLKDETRRLNLDTMPNIFKQVELSMNITESIGRELSALANISAQMDEIQQKAADNSKYERAYKPKDCDDWAIQGHVVDGVYEIWPVRLNRSLQVYCRMLKGQGWIVMQRRRDGLTSFDKPWNDYEFGFGGLYGDFWLGNYFINLLTIQSSYKLRIELTEWENQKRTFTYDKFLVAGSSENYKLSIGRSGDNGWPNDPMLFHDQMTFSAPDKYSVYLKCANTLNSGWWFGEIEDCFKVNLNGYYSESDSRSERIFQDKRMAWWEEKQSDGKPFGAVIKYSSMMISRL